MIHPTHYFDLLANFILCDEEGHAWAEMHWSSNKILLHTTSVSGVSPSLNCILLIVNQCVNQGI